jgi:hypothetical protein
VVKVLLAAVLAAAPCVSAPALQLTFDVVSGDARWVYSETITWTGGGYRAAVKGPTEEATMEMDEKRQTLAWDFSVPKEDTQVSARRVGETISVRGRFRSRPFTKDYAVGTLPWFEYQELALDDFGAADARSIAFATIDRSTMKLVRFRAEKRKEVDVQSLGRTVRAVETVILVDGVPEILFSSRAWLRRPDGRYLRLQVPAVGGTKPTRVELTAESGSLAD